jgi:Nuclease-related domain
MSETWLSPMLAALALLLALAALVLYWPYLTAWLSEFRVGMALSVLPKGDYTLLHDVLIPDGTGGTTRIDHLICGPAGYLVIETVSLSGQITGRASEAEWMQRLPGGRQRRIANPIPDNNRHVTALRQLVDPVPVRGLVVFARARFPDDKPDDVLLPAELTTHIFSMEEQAVPFDAGHSLDTLRQAMITAPTVHRRYARRRQQRYGNAWRKPGGHALAAAAACILALTPVPRPPVAATAAVVRYVPVPLATDKPETHTTYAIRPASRRRPARHAAPHQRQHHDKEPMQVIAMSDGMASILENGRIITLRPGQRSPQGWRLVRATPAYADMISPMGQHFHFTP